MASPYLRDCFHPVSPNSPLMMVCTASLFFNSVKDGVFRPVNMYTNIALIIALSLSNGFYRYPECERWAAKVGLATSACFTVAPKLKVLYTRRLFPQWVHYAIGMSCMTYHALALYQEDHYFEDAGEDAEDERF